MTDSQYEALCDECDTQLSEDVSIEIWERGKDPNQEGMTLCSDCSESFHTEYVDEGWVSHQMIDEADEAGIPVSEYLVLYPYGIDHFHEQEAA